MVLTVPFDQFPAAAKVAHGKDVFLSSQGSRVLVTLADISKNLIVVSTSDLPLEEAEAKLGAAGFNVSEGRWSDPSLAIEASVPASDAYVAAVAYQSRDSMPGLWMDAYPTQPTPQIVLRALYDEFKSNDEIGNASYEEFLKLAKPNVVILPPGEIATFLRQKEEC